MSTAPAPDARRREASPLHALPALPATDGREADADAVGDAMGPVASVPIGRGTDSPALRRGHMSGTDLGEAVARYAALYPGSEFQATPGTRDFSYRYSFVGDANVTLRSSAFLAEHWGRLPALPDYVVVWWREGSGAVDVGSHEVRSSGSRPFLLPSGRAFDFRFQAGVQNLVQVHAAFLEETAAEAHGGRPRPLVFDHTRPPTPERSSAWRRAVGEASPALQDVATSPLLRMQAGLLVARATLELFPWHDVPFSAEMRAPRMSAVRTAIEYMHHHADRPITPADAARAAGISTRVLQLAVRRHEDTTPSALLRGIRLERVRAELRDASPTTTTVRAVAEQWGFGHLGRFAASYEERFGELPSATLRR
ncbi:helix-turn-helix transcriptional regulator [Clavibacter michiganensis]|uniref:helix-turn-helix transcriptional regulator n=1 Tax=Clavibacter michiganensis TaxID=28447 RepID=UPI0005BB84D4|nr:helix-turn-helix transcriptional regulator [Clavibacter michiganensis]